MGSRLKLHEELKSVLGSNNVYFNPPKLLKYPCIVYKFIKPETQNADDHTYISHDRYSITIIDTNLDSTIYKDLINHFHHVFYDNHIVIDNLRHDYLTIYY